MIFISPVISRAQSPGPTPERTFLESSHMMKIPLQNSMERVTFHLMLRYQMERLVERMIVMKMMIL